MRLPKEFKYFPLPIIFAYFEYCTQSTNLGKNLLSFKILIINNSMVGCVCVCVGRRVVVKLLMKRMEILVVCDFLPLRKVSQLTG